MYDYAGSVRSQVMLETGLNHLRRLRTKVQDSLIARNRFELIRCLEVLNLYDQGEVLFLAASQRKESRGLPRRIDYSLTDPLLNGKVLVVKQRDNQPVFEWRQPKN